MYDINFFRDYKHDILVKKYRRVITGLAISVILGLSLGIYLGNMFSIRKMEFVRSQLIEKLNSPDITNTKAQLTYEKIELLLLKSYEAWISGNDLKIRNKYRSALFLADQANIQSHEIADIIQISLYGNSFSLSGYTQTYTHAALFKTRLNQLNFVSDLSIQEVEFEVDHYSFTIIGRLVENT